MKTPAYALVTPAKNEEEYIGRTIQGVLNQTIHPVKWVIVDDGSSDRTAAIAGAYASRHRWISVVQKDPGLTRDFASKVRSFAMGCEQLKDVAYEYLGNLDADVLLGPEYYERIIRLFDGDTCLGIAGGRFYDTMENGRCYPVRNSPDSVRGAVQMFRRRCYEDVGGYLALPMGGIDSAAETMARMKGWKVRTFPGLTVLHLRPTGSSRKSALSALVRRGFQDHSLGYHGLFEVVRCGARMSERPYVIGGLGVLFGYCWSWIRGDQPVLPADTVNFLRGEQRAKLVQRLKRIVSFKRKTDLSGRSIEGK